MQTFRVGDDRVRYLSYSPDGRYLVVGQRDSHDYRVGPELVWWDWAKGEPGRRFRLRDSLYGPGGAQVGHDDWSPESGPIDVAIGFDPFRVALSWDWTGKEDGVCVYDADAQETRMLKVPYKTHTLRLALSPDGAELAVITYADMTGQPSLEVWKIGATAVVEEEAEPEPAEEDQPFDLSMSLTFSPLPAPSRNPRRMEYEQNAVELPLDPVAFAFDGRYVVAAGPGFEGRAWSRTANRGPVVAVWDRHAPPVIAEPAEPDESLDWVPRHAATELTPGFKVSAVALGNGVLAVGGGGLAMWDFQKQEWATIDAPTDITAIAFDATGTRLLVGTASGGLSIWDAEGRRVAAINAGVGEVVSVAFAPDGLTCAAGGDDGRVVVWDLE